MFHAHVAAMMSSGASRQVGASLLSSADQFIGVGVNEVPRFGGGHYTGAEPTDRRDFRLPYDPTDESLELMMKEAAQIFGQGHLTIEDLRAKFDGTTILDVREFSRSVHAEMCALLDAGRRGVRTQDATLYSTTFPCHNCAKHIIAAGIRRVVFIEPFPKSQAEHLHKHEILLTSDAHATGKVLFQPFLGVAPRRHSQLFYRKANPVQSRAAAKAQPWEEVGGRFAAASELAEIQAVRAVNGFRTKGTSLPDWLRVEFDTANKDFDDLSSWLRDQLANELS